MNVGEMDLDEGDFYRQQGVAQGDAGVGEGGGVEDDEIDAFVGGGVDVVD